MRGLTAIQDNPSVDHQLLKRLEHDAPTPSCLDTGMSRVLVLAYADHPGRYVFGPAELSRLATSTQRLNDDCINNLAVMLQLLLSQTPDVGLKASACSIFSSYDLVTIQDGLYNRERAGERIWDRAEHLQYWDRVVWIIPIHRKVPFEHWVLAIVLQRSSRMYLFDSLNGNNMWQSEAEVCDLVPFNPT